VMRSMVDNSQRYVEVYGEDDYMRDEAEFDKIENDGKLNMKELRAFQRLMLNDLAVNTNIIETGCIGDIHLKDIDLALKYPHKGWQILLKVSEQLMLNSPHYYRMNMLYSNMALFCWGVDLITADDEPDEKTLKTMSKMHFKLLSKLEDMHLKHEFSKIMKCLPYQDIYCGLVVENATDFFFQKIDYRICRLYQVQDGLYNFQINLAAINPKEIGGYPDYVQDAYVKYKNNDKVGTNWYLPPADKQICVKLNTQWSFPYPMLIGLVRDILDLNVYKKLKLQSARTDNYKAIMVKVPIDTSTVDKPLLSPRTLGVFAEMNRESMSDDIGMIHVLGDDGEAISFKDSSNTTNNVSDAVTEIYNDGGITQELFNGSSSGTAVTFSVENVSGFVYGVYRSLETWMDRFIKLRKYNRSTFKFAFYLLDATIFNREKVTKRYQDVCMVGIPAVDRVMASLDMSPSRTFGANILHNKIFDYYGKFKPLASSYNSTADALASSNESGRPTNEERGEILSDEGELTKDGEKNDR